MSSPMARWYAPRNPNTGPRMARTYQADIVFEGAELSGTAQVAPPGSVPLGALLQASIQGGSVSQFTGLACQRSSDGAFYVTVGCPDGASAGTITIIGSITPKS